jgi:hypothetical protein
MCYQNKQPRWETIDALFGDLMEFTLTYRGPLPSSQSDGNKKGLQFEMRRDFHRQLKEVWEHFPLLGSRRFDNLAERTSGQPIHAWYKQRVGLFTFVPLVIIGSSLKLVCGLKIKLLSRDDPGSIVHNGDLDNRLKVLFDTLAVPQFSQLPTDAKPESDENPFLCLLGDDKLITSLAVDTGKLHRPAAADDQRNHVEIDITVLIKAGDKNTAAIQL